ncbi:MAG TPA: GIY-YIG nuclease family protein [Gammaproteobacteria bacterium]|nr:GIY-YIG nuclease family protein [Gammaproteobacteria bacterium]
MRTENSSKKSPCTPKAWYVYIIRCADRSLYTGITTDVTRRVREHCAQGKRTAKYLRGKAPLKLVLQLAIGNKDVALQVEYKIKQLSKAQKEAMITCINQGMLTVNACETK